MVYQKKKRPPAGDPILEKWETLCEAAPKLDEAECLRLIRIEKAGRRRKPFLERLASRWNRAKRARERAEVVEGQLPKEGFKTRKKAGR